MALVAIDAVVDVALHALVISVRLILRVAIGALENGIVVRIRVACGADIVGVPVIRWEGCVLCVIESCIQPVRRVVARLAGGREKLRLRRVSRVCSLVVIGLMATDAGCRQCGVVVIDVAIDALARRDRVGTSEGEGCRVVVEG